MMEAIQSVTQFESLRDNTEKPVVFVFSADWCPDCRFLDVFIDEVAAEYEDRLTLVKIDRDAYAEICDSLEIMGIPSFVAFLGGQVVSRFVNGKRKTRAEVEEFLDGVLHKPN